MENNLCPNCKKMLEDYNSYYFICNECNTHYQKNKIKGPCAKTTVKCVIVSSKGIYTGTNYCNNSQKVCPRNEGEDYTKCETVCEQEGHAEIVALKNAAGNIKNGHAYIEGHNFYCEKCQLALFNSGVNNLSVGIPLIYNFQIKY